MCESLARGGFYHAGQVCVSVQRVYLNKKLTDNFIPILIDEVKKVNLGDPMHKETVVGPLIRNSEVLRVDSWVKESSNNGSEIILGDGILSDCTYDKTIILNPKQEDKVSQNEIFGPVITINEFDDFDKAIDDANSVNVSFQSSIFTDKIPEILKFYERINASAVFHNDHTAFRVDWMPFAGLKHSGHGVVVIKNILCMTCRLKKMLVLRK